ncbi:hypothetical protein T01_13596 [Trichinella spiralis]|uniref:Uncharacterized protein n=1 Tax=Trichinella spiralis TaxID=6334 RepID=A0A0V1BDS2_TRISP|nr:hypothetical protein T01_13596 [Trichinella spiralis]
MDGISTNTPLAAIRNIQYYYLTINMMATKLMLTGIGLLWMACARSSIRLKAKSKSRSSQKRTVTHIWKDKTNIIQMKG